MFQLWTAERHSKFMGMKPRNKKTTILEQKVYFYAPPTSSIFCNAAATTDRLSGLQLILCQLRVRIPPGFMGEAGRRTQQ